MRRFVGGDAGAFGALHARHFDRVYGAMRRAGLDHAAAADLAQDVFLRVVQAAGQFDPTRGSFAAWTGAIARHCLARHFAATGRQVNVDAALLADSQVGREDEPPVRAVTAEEIAAVDDCVSRLPADLRRIVERRYVEGQTTRAIAAAVRISEAGVRNRLSEAKDLLARCLGGKGVL